MAQPQTFSPTDHSLASHELTVPQGTLFLQSIL